MSRFRCIFPSCREFRLRSPSLLGPEFLISSPANRSAGQAPSGVGVDETFTSTPCLLERLDRPPTLPALWLPMSDIVFPFPVLVCDTGGTNVRFAIQPEATAPLGEIVHLITDDYPGLPEAIEAAAPKLKVRPRSMIVCGAGPVVGRKLKLTNAPWVMDGPETARRAGLAQGLLLNDFEAQALSLPAIPDDWTHQIGPLPVRRQGAARDPWPRHRPRHRGARRGGRPLYASVVGGLPHRLRTGDGGGIRPLAASRTGARAGDQRKRAERGGAGESPPGADDGPRPPGPASRAAARSPPRRSPTRRARRRRASGTIGGSWRASPATWR